MCLENEGGLENKRKNEKEREREENDVTQQHDHPVERFSADFSSSFFYRGDVAAGGDRALSNKLPRDYAMNLIMNGAIATAIYTRC